MSDKKKTLRIPMSERLYGRSDCRIIAERFVCTLITENCACVLNMILHWTRKRVWALRLRLYFKNLTRLALQ